MVEIPKGDKAGGTLHKGEVVSPLKVNQLHSGKRLLHVLWVNPKLVPLPLKEPPLLPKLEPLHRPSITLIMIRMMRMFLFKK